MTIDYGMDLLPPAPGDLAPSLNGTKAGNPMQKPNLTLDVNLSGSSEQPNATPFRIRLEADPLAELLLAAADVNRMYELFLLQMPSDLWDYITVRVIEAAPEADRILSQRLPRIHPHPTDVQHRLGGRQFPFPLFERLFDGLREDADPIDRAWDGFLHSNELRTFLLQALAQVQEAQTQTRRCSPLSRHVWNMILTKTHPYCLLPREDAFRKSRSGGPQPPQHTASFYAELSRILEDERLNSVVYRANGDLRVFRLLANEQRRRVETGASALYLGALSDLVLDGSCWDAQIAFYGEGLPYGDLLIQGIGLESQLLRQFEGGHRLPGRYVFAGRDFGELDGFTKQAGDGWVLYEAQRPIEDEESRRLTARNLRGIRSAGAFAFVRRSDVD